MTLRECVMLGGSSRASLTCFRELPEVHVHAKFEKVSLLTYPEILWGRLASRPYEMVVQKRHFLHAEPQKFHATHPLSSAIHLSHTPIAAFLLQGTLPFIMLWTEIRLADYGRK
jgi:hypothetical protein